MARTSTIYQQTDWLFAGIAAAFTVAFLIIAAGARDTVLLMLAGLVALLVVAFYPCRITVYSDRLAVRLGVWRLTMFSVEREEVESARAYRKRWDGVNWPVGRVRDLEGQSRGGLLLPGVLLRCRRGGFWVSTVGTHRSEALVGALASAWGVPKEA